MDKHETKDLGALLECPQQLNFAFKSLLDSTFLVYQQKEKENGSMQMQCVEFENNAKQNFINEINLKNFGYTHKGHQ